MQSTLKKYVRLSISSLAIGLLNQPQDVNAMPAAGCISSLVTMTIISTKLSFATMVPCTTASGTVSVNPATGALTASPVCINTSGTALRARVKVNGNQGAGSPDRILVTLSSGATINSGGDTMAITGLALNPGGGTTATFQAKLSATYDIGGTLNVGTSQPGGSYSGTFSITAVCI